MTKKAKISKRVTTTVREEHYFDEVEVMAILRKHVGWDKAEVEWDLGGYEDPWFRGVTISKTETKVDVE